MITEDKLIKANQEEQTAPQVDKKEENSFADLLEDYDVEPLIKGQFVEGEILQIEDNVILADVDAKRTAVIPPQDLEKIEDGILEQLAVGDEVTLYVLRTPIGEEDLLVSLNKGLEQQDWADAQDYLADEELLELEVIGYNKGGLIVAFGNLHGFVPRSHVPQLQHVHNKTQLASKKAKLVGEQLPLKVIEVNRNQRRLILSAKKAQGELRRNRLEELKLQEGETIRGRITNLVKFGAFVDLGGVEGLVHISEIAWENVEDPADYLAPGEAIEVMVQSVDIEEERVSLSRKALQPSPWDLFDESHAVGDLLEGVVMNVTDFGAFVLVADGIEGLVHVSEMRGTRNAAPQDVLFPGDTILVRILNIQPERQRLALSQRQISRDEEMAWIWQQEQLSAKADEEE
jgi:small subunit ribosomal protein S1